MENFIEIYNPRNASKLTEEQIQAMPNLTDEQIKALAEAYPNQPTGNAYLKYFIKSDGEKQRFPLGTWKNLHSLRKLGKKDISAFGFTKSKLPDELKGKKVAAKKTVDLGANDTIEGLKTGVDVVIPGIPVDPKEYTGEVFLTEAEIAHDTALAELEEAKVNKAHPQTIKKLERAVEATETALKAEKENQ